MSNNRVSSVRLIYVQFTIIFLNLTGVVNSTSDNLEVQEAISSAMTIQLTKGINIF